MKNSIPKMLINALIDEIYEFDGYLEDTRENIEAPLDQLTPEGQYIIKGLHEQGIKTQSQLDIFEAYLRAIVNYKPQ